MKNSDYNEFGFKNNFGARVLSTLEIGLMKWEKDDMSVYYNTNRVEREYFTPIAQYVVMFSRYFEWLDINVSLWVNQNSVTDYWMELDKHWIDVLRWIFTKATKQDWWEKPLYFYTLMVALERKIDEMYCQWTYSRMIEIEEKWLSILNR
jgi:hypothetical protein